MERPKKSDAQDLLEKAKELSQTGPNKAKLESLISKLGTELKACKNIALTTPFFQAYENLDEAIKRL